MSVETATPRQAPAVLTHEHRSVEAKRVATPRALLEKAQKATRYIGNTELGGVLTAVLSAQSSSLQDIAIPTPLRAQAQAAIGLARNKQQSAFAAEILPMAQQLLENAQRAGLTRSSRTDKGRVTVFEGQAYSVRYRENRGKQEFKVLCHKTEGLIYAVDGKLKKIQGLLKIDKAAFARSASMTSTQLRQAARAKQSNAKAEIGL